MRSVLSGKRCAWYKEHYSEITSAAIFYCKCSLGCCFSAEILCSIALLLIQLCVLRQQERTVTLCVSCRKRREGFHQRSKGRNSIQDAYQYLPFTDIKSLMQCTNVDLNGYWILLGVGGEQGRSSQALERDVSSITEVFFTYIKSLQAENLNGQSAQGEYWTNCSFLFQILVFYFSFSVSYMILLKCYFP